jgi:hypothetical protein
VLLLDFTDRGGKGVTQVDWLLVGELSSEGGVEALDVPARVLLATERHGGGRCGAIEHPDGVVDHADAIFIGAVVDARFGRPPEPTGRDVILERHDNAV